MLVDYSHFEGISLIQQYTKLFLLLWRLLCFLFRIPFLLLVFGKDSAIITILVISICHHSADRNEPSSSLSTLPNGMN
jgi:hypothetical protein